MVELHVNDITDIVPPEFYHTVVVAYRAKKTIDDIEITFNTHKQALDFFYMLFSIVHEEQTVE